MLRRWGVRVDGRVGVGVDGRCRAHEMSSLNLDLLRRGCRCWNLETEMEMWMRMGFGVVK